MNIVRFIACVLGAVVLYEIGMYAVILMELFT